MSGMCNDRHSLSARAGGIPSKHLDHNAATSNCTRTEFRTMKEKNF